MGFESAMPKLLSDFPISIPLEFTEGSPRIDLNGHSVDNMWLKLDCRAIILGDGTLNYLTISNNAGLTDATPVVNVLWIADGATWSSILPDASFGDKVYNRDMSSYKWYESGSVGEIAIEKEMEGQSDKTYQIFWAGIQPLPIKEAPILMLGGVPLEDGRVRCNLYSSPWNKRRRNHGERTIEHLQLRRLRIRVR